jgi:DNA-binding transcriptional LysR family regulator
VAQQAVSREVRRLEDELGTTLIDRSTRRVRLTPAGAELLDRARELVALHDAVVDEVRGMRTALVVDIVAEHLTPHLLVRAARDAHGADIVIRTGGGLAAALPALNAGDLDVAFGQVDPARLPAAIGHRVVRDEPLGLLVLEDHPLAGEQSIPVSRLRGLTIDTSAGNPDATEWTELAATYLESWRARPAPPHRHVVGPAETARHLAAEQVPILSHTTVADVPGAVLVGLTDPTPTYRWRMLWRHALRHPALEALHRAVDEAEPTLEWSAPAADPATGAESRAELRQPE